MKVLFFTDVHGSMKSVKEVVKKSEKVDLITCCGDLSRMGSGYDELINELSKTKKIILIIPGNNETPSFVKEAIKDYDNIHCVHEEIYQDKGIKFLGLGGSTATPFNTPYELTETEYDNKLKKFSKVNILISHCPPKNTKLDKTSKGMNVGSFSIRKWIEKNQPDFCACGHVHENQGKEEKIGKTLCFNPGKTGRIIKIT